MVEYVYRNSISSALIFEDDFFPLYKDWQNRIEHAISELPDDWHILLLGYTYGGFIYRWNHCRFLRPLIKPLTMARPMAKRYSKHLDFAGIGYGGHAYCISKAGADYLCTYFNPMRISGDHLIVELIKKKKLNAYTIYPNLFSQDRNQFGTKTE